MGITIPIKSVKVNMIQCEPQYELQRGNFYCIQRTVSTKPGEHPASSVTSGPKLYIRFCERVPQLSGSSSILCFSLGNRRILPISKWRLVFIGHWRYDSSHGKATLWRFSTYKQLLLCTNWKQTNKKIIKYKKWAWRQEVTLYNNIHYRDSARVHWCYFTDVTELHDVFPGHI